jgi:hypothetical protein
VLLSGGLGSRIVVAAADRPIQCLHFNDWRNREYELASAIAASREFPFTHLQRSDDHYVEIFPTAVCLSNGMHGFVHGHGINLVPAEGVGPLLHGFVPELFFRGTNLPKFQRTFSGRHIRWQVDESITSNTIVDKIVEKLKYSQSHANPAQWFTSALRTDFRDVIRAPASRSFRKLRRRRSHPWTGSSGPTPTGTTSIPPISSSTPFVRSTMPGASSKWNDVLDLHLRMPVASRSDSAVWNLAVKRLNRSVSRVKDANTGRSPSTSTAMEIAARAAAKIRLKHERPIPAPRPWWTQGSWPDHVRLLAENPRLNHLISSVLEDEECLPCSIFDRQHIDSCVGDLRAGRSQHRRTLWQLLQLATVGEYNRRFGPTGGDLPSS